MRKYWIIALLGLAAASFGQQTENNELACDCPSCREKAASGKEFSLAGLQGLEDGYQEKDTPDRVAEAVPHDHDGDGISDHAVHDDQASAAVLHDHDGDGVSDHTTHDDPAAEAIPHDHDGDGISDHDSHEGHAHGADDRHAHGGSDGIILTQAMFDKLGIQVHEAEGGAIAKASDFPAEIKLNRDRTAAVSPRYASIVRQVFAEIGDSVQKGDVLASLENRETMAVYTVAAPQEGIIISKDLAPGETAGDDHVLFEVADLSSVWADISIFPQYQHLLRKGMPVKFIAHDGHTSEGRIKYISPIVSHETRTFTARCILEEPAEDFTPGAFVRAKINVQTADVPVSVPRKAVQTIGGESVVFVPSPSGFITAPVKTGLADEIRVEVMSGLQPGDKYVAVGAFALKAQMVTSGMDPHAGHGH
jgi:cobalt-zinc-cadmium efflux system membrane fusion protein